MNQTPRKQNPWLFEKSRVDGDSVGEISGCGSRLGGAQNKSSEVLTTRYK